MKLSTNPRSKELLEKFLGIKKINIGDTVEYLNKDNKPGRDGLTYTVKDVCKIKDPNTREWMDGVIYIGKLGTSYVRELKDFYNNFRIINK